MAVHVGVGTTMASMSECACRVTGGVLGALGVRWAEPRRDEGFESRLWSRER